MNKINESGTVTFGQAWKDFWVGYFDFKGTSTRDGFWWGALIYFVCTFIVGFIKEFIKGFISGMGMIPDQTVVMTIYYVLLIIITIPLLAAATRHLRDEGLKNGLIAILLIVYIILQVLIQIKLQMLLLALAAIFNIAMIVLLCMPTGKFNKE